MDDSREPITDASAAAPRAARKGRLLVVDDEPLKRITLQIELSEQGYEVFEAADALTAKRVFDTQPIDVVISDVRMPGMSGLDFLTYVRRARPGTAVILMTAYATIENAVLAIKRGAYDYITKPFTTQELLTRLEQLFAARTPPPDSDEVAAFGDLIARSQAMKQVFAQLRAAAAGQHLVLLCGESGTGKELLAAALHAHSPRAARPFLAIHGATLQAAAGDAELFGADKSTSGGPVRQRPGRIELAAGGTVLLDEIDDISPDLQARLLRLIERGEFERLGGEEVVRVDVRLIGATRRNLLALVREGRFREDLYYRLDEFSIRIPPLRERLDDVPVLARHFLAKHAGLAGGRRLRLSPHALDELMRHTWPGNVRELEHVIERALALCDGDEVRPEHVLPLSGEVRYNVDAPQLELSEASAQGLNETMADIERRMILMALRQCQGNQARAAQRLGIPRTTLRDRMARYNIPEKLRE